MEIKLTETELAEVVADHLNGCKRRTSDTWMVTFHFDGDTKRLTGATFTTPKPAEKN